MELEVQRRVGVRELKNGLSAVLRLVRDGETVTVTDRKQPVALLVPIRQDNVTDTIRGLSATGKLSWNGAKPKGLEDPPKVRGPSVSDAVVEDRR